MYLGVKLHNTRFHNRVWAWEMSPVNEVQDAVRNHTVHFVANYGGKHRLCKKAENPCKMGYNSELYTSSELDELAAS